MATTTQVPATETVAEATDTNFNLIDDEHTFMMAISEAKLNNKPCVEVSQRLFSYLMKGQAGNALDFQGVRVYPPGAREKVEAHESKRLF